MPTYELDMNGKSYEVDAPSIEAFTQAYQGGAGQGDFFHPVKPAPGSGWRGVLERLTQYPRIALGEIGDAFHTLGQVSHGQIDATSPEAIKAATNLASVMGPAGEFAGTGAQIARRAGLGKMQPAEAAPSGIEAAQTAADLGSPLPAGIVSDTPGVKAFTQGFRQMPFVGAGITEKVGQTVRAAGSRVGDIAEEMSGGSVADRATVGAQTRQSLQDVIADNNAKIGEVYNDLRTNHINPEGTAPLPSTTTALNAIKAERIKAGQNPSAGLGDIENLISEDRDFNGLQRARSELGSQLEADRQNPNPGFYAGDKKRLYAAMTNDMANVVRRNALNDPGEAIAALQTANSTAHELINRNAAISRLIGKTTSDEGIAGKLINSAKEKGGNVGLLAELRGQMPREDFEKISGIVLNELGHNKSTGEFSLNQFVSNWNKMSPSAKSTLIADASHRKALDDIAGLGHFLKDADKYRNTSNTAHAVGITGALAYLAEHATDPHALGTAAAALAGGYGLSKILARPASASALRRWMQAAAKAPQTRFATARSAAALSGLSIATRNLLNNLPETTQSTQAQQSQRRQPLRVTVHPQNVAPSP